MSEADLGSAEKVNPMQEAALLPMEQRACRQDRMEGKSRHHSLVCPKRDTTKIRLIGQEVKDDFPELSAPLHDLA